MRWRIRSLHVPQGRCLRWNKPILSVLLRIFCVLCVISLCTVSYMALVEQRHFPQRTILLRDIFTFNATKNISCSLLINGSETERSKAHTFMKSVVRISKLSTLVRNHGNISQDLGFITDCISDEERDFPLAFAIIMYKDVEQTVRLLRAIYRPHNFYCIHVDAKSPESIYQTLKFIASSLDNVFLPSERINVVYATYKDLEPEIVCLRELLKRSNKWKYFINLTGQEFPIRTNYELVKMLQAYNGANDIEGTIGGDYRWRYGSLKLPHNLKPMKGGVHILASRTFIEFAITNPIAQDLLKWIEKNNPAFPGELFYATLQYNPQLNITGTYLGKANTAPLHVRYKMWGGPCAGKFMRAVCVFGIGDLPRITASRAAIANKFVYEYQPLAYDCLEEWYFDKVRKECAGDRTFNNTFYKTLLSVTNVVKG